MFSCTSKIKCDFDNILTQNWDPLTSFSAVFLSHLNEEYRFLCLWTLSIECYCRRKKKSLLLSGFERWYDEQIFIETLTRVDFTLRKRKVIRCLLTWFSGEDRSFKKLKFVTKRFVSMSIRYYFIFSLETWKLSSFVALKLANLTVERCCEKNLKSELGVKRMFFWDRVRC